MFWKQLKKHLNTNKKFKNLKIKKKKEKHYI